MFAMGGAEAKLLGGVCETLWVDCVAVTKWSSPDAVGTETKRGKLDQLLENT